jgi:hypothetical protein
MAIGWTTHGIYAILFQAMAASDNQALRETEELDPTLFTTAFKRNRFFMFTQREPNAYVLIAGIAYGHGLSHV